MNRSLKRGFTLIELMVVILILAILAALVVPRVLGKVDEAKVSKAQADLATLSSALQDFRLHCDRYPTTEEGLAALRTAPSDLQGKWTGPYIDKDISNDPWQHAYQYKYPSSSGAKDTFDLSATEPDGTVLWNGSN